ncbi:hypothetical protein MMC31_006612 [Peltigera leucophlebia]|nr:hypothetical protein [Peltigera leucophlebia]
MAVPHYFRRIIFSFALVSTFLWIYNSSGVSLQPKYNSFSCPGFVTPTIRSNGLANRKNTTTTSSTASSSVISSSKERILPDFTQSPFAYVFYATQPDYACSVLVNIDRLQNLFNTSHRIIVLVRPDLASPYLTAFTRLNATVIPYNPPELKDEQVGYYHDVLLKLVAFRLHHYIPSLSRILILDSDQLILQSLDHVFDLPPVDVAAPRAYWGQDGTGFTSAFLLVTLSDRVWDRMAQKLETIRQNVFDMDLVNEMFKQTVLILPGDYATLNSHWETNDIPSWWMGDTPVWPYTQLPKEMVPEMVPEEDELYNGQPVVQQQPQPTQQQQASQQASKQEQVPQQQQASQKLEPPQQSQQPEIQQPAQPYQNHPKQPSQEVPTPPSKQQTEQIEQTPQHQQPPSTSLGQPSQAPTQSINEENPKPKIQRRSPNEDEEAKKLAYEEDQLRKRREVYNALLHEIYAAVKVLHFTALGKPWSWHIGDVVEAKPLAHDLFKVQFETWQKASQTLCNPEWQ